METKLLEILIAVMLTACALMVIGMLAFGPRILEWLEGAPREAGPGIGRIGGA
jgi:hypothetical protein